ncbi:MAG: hypothetical protein R6V85_05680 [Polyangia bacterium]
MTFLFTFFLAASQVTTFFLALLARNPATEEAAYGLPIPILIGVAIFTWMVGYAWSSIQDEQSPISTGKAVGFLFIPFFNLYWLFVVLPGFATEYRKYAQRHNLDVEPPSKGVLIAWAILTLVHIPVATLVLTIIGAIQIGMAVARLEAARGAS